MELTIDRIIIDSMRKVIYIVIAYLMHAILHIIACLVNERRQHKS